MNKRDFSDRVRREVDVILQEMRDGCLDCRRARGYCFTHQREADEAVLRPRQAIEKARAMMGG